ncbi:glycopeptide [Lentinula edodes]|nr:glycopeptide [Lentinula edodes]
MQVPSEEDPLNPLQSWCGKINDGVHFSCDKYGTTAQMLRLLLNIAAFSAILAAGVKAENHTVKFLNNCGIGTPLLKQNGVTLSTGASYTINGPFSAIALNILIPSGNCGSNGEGCTVVETTLANSGSSTTFNMSSYSIPTGFAYFNGCDGEGWDCTIPGCPGATGIISPLPIECLATNVDLEITFCD